MIDLRIVVIGFGLMGLGVVLLLVCVGFVVVGVDLVQVLCDELVVVGGSLVVSFVEVVWDVDVVFVYVVNVVQMWVVLFGDQGVIVVVWFGMIFVLCLIMLFDDMIVIVYDLYGVGMVVIDVLVLGGIVKVWDGQISIMVLGLVVVFDCIQFVLDVIVVWVFWLGDQIGVGSWMKLINQFLVGVYIVVMVEVMVFVVKFGLDFVIVQQVIIECVGNSWMFQNCGLQVVLGDYMLFFVVDIFVKDLGIVIEVVQSFGSLVLLVDVLLDLYCVVFKVGFGCEVDVVIVKILVEKVGVMLF